MGMRDWLIIIVIVGIILILLDGYRRKRKDSIRVKLDKNIPSVDLDVEDAAELPNGGARVIPRYNNFNDDKEYSDEDYQDYADDSDDDDQIVPVLMDAIELDKGTAKKEFSINSNESEQENSDDIEEDNDWESDDYSDDDEEDHAEDSSDEFDVYDDDDDDTDDESIEEEDLEEISSHNSGINEDEDYDEDEDYEDDLDDEEISSVRVQSREEQFPVSQSATKSTGNTGKAGKERIEPTFGLMEKFSDAELDDRPARAIPSQSKKQKKNLGDSNEAPAIVQAELFSESPEDFIQNEDGHDDSDDGFLEPEEVIVINVMAKKGELFAGSDLLPILMKHGMRLGNMSIFHKHADSSDNGPIVFSMANMVKPGTFDVTQMEEFSTPGVSFFLQLPNAYGNMKSFEQMLSAADSIKASLNGDLKDEQRSVITRQTIEHCRQRIQDFELAQLSKK